MFWSFGANNDVRVSVVLIGMFIKPWARDSDTVMRMVYKDRFMNMNEMVELELQRLCGWRDLGLTENNDWNIIEKE